MRAGKATIIVLILLAMIPCVQAGSWEDWGYLKRVAINISTPGTSISPNYTLPLNVTYDSDMQTNFGDVRFFNSSMNSQLYYWIQSKADGEYASIWVKVDQRVNVGGNYTIYMAYAANETKTTTSSQADVCPYGSTSDVNGNPACWIFHESFSTDVFDNGNWSRSNAARAYVSGGYLNIPNEGTNDDWALFNNSAGMVTLYDTSDVAIETRTYADTSGGLSDDMLGHHQWQNESADILTYAAYRDDPTYGWFLYSGWTVQTTPTPATDTWTKQRTFWNHSTASLYVNLTDQTPLSYVAMKSGAAVSNNKIQYLKWAQSWDVNMSIDWVGIRRLANPQADYFMNEEEGLVPGISIISPTNITYYNSSISLKVTSTVTINTWKYSLNGNANVTFTPNTTITASVGLNNLVVWGDDSSTGDWYSDDVFFTVKFHNITSEIYDSILYSPYTTTYKIVLNITNEYAISSLNASLIVNGTEYSYDYYTVSGTLYTFQKSMKITESGNFVWESYWNITIYGVGGTITYDTTDKHTQPGYYITVTDCSYGISSITFNLKDESTLSAVSGDIDVLFTIWKTAGDTIEYSFNYSSITSKTFCIYPNMSSYNANINIIYNASGYSQRIYDIGYTVLDNTTDTYNLYLLPSELSSKLLIHITDYNNVEIPDAIIKIQKYNHPTTAWITLQAVKTDNDGKALSWILLNREYRFVIEIGGSEISTVTKMIVDTINDPEEITIKTTAESVEYFVLIAGLTMSCNFDNSTNIQRCYVSDASGLMKQSTMIVEKLQPLGYATICSLTSTLATKTHQCNLGENATGEYRVTLKIITENDVYLVYVGSISIPAEPYFGDTGIFMIIVMIIALTLILSSWNPQIALLMSGVGLAIGVAFQIMPLSIASVIGVLIGGVVIALKV